MRMRRVCQSVAAGLEGQALASFTRVSSAVKAAVEAALHRILTPRRSIDVLRDIQARACLGSCVHLFQVRFDGACGLDVRTVLSDRSHLHSARGAFMLIES